MIHELTHPKSQTYKSEGIEIKNLEFWEILLKLQPHKSYGGLSFYEFMELVKKYYCSYQPGKCILNLKGEDWNENEFQKITKLLKKIYRDEWN